MDESAFSQIYIFSRSVKDFRTGNHLLYSSTSIIFMALVGILCGATGWEEIELVCQNKKEVLKNIFQMSSQVFLLTIVSVTFFY